MLTHYLSEVSLLTDMDEDDSSGDNKVTLMTVHAAKGLEFETVFVVGLEEELFPSSMSMDSPKQIEEERRLFYVVMTRARQYLHICYVKERYHRPQPPSRFIQETGLTPEKPGRE